jgi:lysozyme
MSNLFSMLKRHEGLKLKPYKDTKGLLTIGIGRCLETKGITELEAEMLCNNDIAQCMVNLRSFLPWFDKLDSVRQDVLMDMCFNLGISGLLKFHNTLTLIEQGKYIEASKEMLNSEWAKQVGDRAVELSYMIEIGKYR